MPARFHQFVCTAGSAGPPYLGRTARWQNLICATGHAMMGLSLAPATGRIVEELVSDSEPGIPLTLLSPDRY